MQTEAITLDREKARELYRAYKKHAHYSDPMDDEIRRAYQLLAQGRLIIRALESIRTAGLDDKGLPKLAIAPATAKECFLRRYRNGKMVMSPKDDIGWRRNSRHFHFGEGSIEFPVETFSTYVFQGTRYRRDEDNHKGLVPIVPVHLRPKRGLANYHILWEAEWTPTPPTDPYLLRRIGKADMWLVVAMWDLTEVERAALATRIGNA